MVGAFEPMIRGMIRSWNNHHMAFLVLGSVVRERARSMPIAPDVNDPEYWDQRAKEARQLAERMIDEMAKQTMLSVAEVCDRFAVLAAMCSIYELAVRAAIRSVDETKGS
jgi:hypothetical protein